MRIELFVTHASVKQFVRLPYRYELLNLKSVLIESADGIIFFVPDRQEFAEGCRVEFIFSAFEMIKRLPHLSKADVQQRQIHAHHNDIGKVA